MIEALIFLWSIYILVKRGKHAILFYPIIGTLFDIFKGYFEHNFITENYRFIFLFLLLILFYIPYLNYKKGKPILHFIFFLFFLLLLNPLSDSWKPSQITSTVNVSSILFMYLVGYNYFDDFKKLKIFYNILVFNSFILFIYFIVIQFFDFELVAADSSYSETFKSHHFDYDIYTVSYTVLVSFFIRWNLSSKKEFILNTIIIALNLLLLIIFMKRWAIFCTFLGIFYYLRLSGEFFKKTRSFSLVILISFFSAFLFSDIIVEQFKSRGNKVSGFESIETEGRTFDYLNMYHYIKTNKSMKEILIGGNLFESRDFGMKYLKEVRNIHPDILAILYGTGFLGLFLYYRIYFWLYKSIKIVTNSMDLKSRNRDLYSIFLVFVIVLLFISIAGGALRVTTADSIAFLFMGAVMRLIINNFENNYEENIY